MMLHLLRNPEAERVSRARAERVPVKNIRSFCSPSDFSLSIVTACERKLKQELGMKKLLLKVRADWEFLAVNSAGGSPSLTSLLSCHPNSGPGLLSHARRGHR